MFKWLIFFILASALRTQNAYCQARTSDSQTALSASVKSSASKMGAALLAGDYATFAAYTYPALLQAVGGAAKMAELMKKTVSDMRAKGMAFGGVTFDEPAKVVKSGNELQTTIMQHLTITLSPGRVVATSTLIAISTDNGKSWGFVDTTNKDMATLRKALPNLSPYITIPPQQPPVRYNL